MISTQRVVEVAASDLPLHCPMPGQQAWSSHPRVFLAVEEKGEAFCPYCGTLYRIKDWQGSSGKHH